MSSRGGFTPLGEQKSRLKTDLPQLAHQPKPTCREKIRRGVVQRQVLLVDHMQMTHQYILEKWKLMKEMEQVSTSQAHLNQVVFMYLDLEELELEQITLNQK